MPSATKHIVIIDGHPDGAPERFVHAVVNAYADGARQSGHRVDIIAVGKLAFPLLRTAEDFEHGAPPDTIRAAQQLIKQADHLVIVYPLWLGSMPALLKGFLEQALRPGFAFAYQSKGLPKKLLARKSARVIVTMGMPGLFYRWYYRAHSLKSLERNILGFVGVSPVRATVIGMVGAPEKQNPKQRAWLKRVSDLGMRAR